MEQGLPPFLSTLAISESDMRSNRSSCVDARGPYQIMPSNTNNPKYDIYADDSLGIDERENPYLAARAASRILAEGKRLIQQRGPGGRTDGYVDGVTFSDSITSLMLTSAYHAGGGTLRDALRTAKRELAAAGRPVDAEALFSHILSAPKAFNKFREESKDYPVKLIPVIDAVYGGSGGEGGASQRVPDLSIVEISRFNEKTGLKDIVRLTGMRAEELRALNPQFRWEKTKDEIRLSAKTVARARLVVPTSLAWRLTSGLISEQRVDAEGLSSRHMLNAEKLAASEVELLAANDYVNMDWSRLPWFE